MLHRTAAIAVLVLTGCNQAPLPVTPAETMEKMQDCIDDWLPACADLDFSPLNGIERRYLTVRSVADAFVPSPIVCEEDATAAHCVRVRWRTPADEKR